MMSHTSLAQTVEVYVEVFDPWTVLLLFAARQSSFSRVRELNNLQL